MNSNEDARKMSDANDGIKSVSPSKDYHPVVVEPLHQEDFEDDISAA